MVPRAEAMRAAATAIADHVAGLVAGGAGALRARQIQRDQQGSRIVSVPKQALRFELSTNALVEALVVGRAYHQCGAAGAMASPIFLGDLSITLLPVGDRNDALLLTEQR